MFNSEAIQHSGEKVPVNSFVICILSGPLKDLRADSDMRPDAVVLPLYLSCGANLMRSVEIFLMENILTVIYIKMHFRMESLNITRCFPVPHLVIISGLNRLSQARNYDIIEMVISFEGSGIP